MLASATPSRSAIRDRGLLRQLAFLTVKRTANGREVEDVEELDETSAPASATLGAE